MTLSATGNIQKHPNLHIQPATVLTRYGSNSVWLRLQAANSRLRQYGKSQLLQLPGWVVVFICAICAPFAPTDAQVEQINVARIELMANEPSPFIIRDWKQVARLYDSLVYDAAKTGEHLPLVQLWPQGYNYADRPSFGLHTYVGTFSPENGEAINILPSLVGATLVDIDKTNQFGQNWILMSQDFFNLTNQEFLYLNNFNGSSGHDWWYDMMPNIYFYQLYDLYGPIGDAENQFHHIAEKMATAVSAMGGSATPWTRASMNYRAWNFKTMQPNPDGVHEPEAAGAFAWLLYQAYRKTGDINYLQAAEWSMEFLVNLGNNPSYELQLPYGAYTAARMNAEIGTRYNIEKLLFWIFNRGPLRGWGTIVGNWNNFDVSGLVGEANDGGNDYAFQLNGVQQAGALVPLVRYDKRFARAIGKWMLNLANATRLMFPGYLPAHLQDASAWSAVYDPQGVMGYEALREQWQGESPFATGDALKGGWAATNLSLYSTSSIGYLGALIEQTNDPKILMLDLLKTDFFHDNAYPSYLIFNPYPETKSVTLNIGSQEVDIYDAISGTFLAIGVSGEAPIEIPADQAVSIVMAPSGGEISFDNNKMLINGVVVDYMQTQIPYNYPPRIQAFATHEIQVEQHKTITLYGKGIDQETKDLIYTFILPDDTISGLENILEWTAPGETGTVELKLIVEDEAHQTDTSVLILDIVSEVNIAPEIIRLAYTEKYTLPNGTIDIHAEVIDANGDPITYSWSATSGEITGSAEDITWHAPDIEGIYMIQLTVRDDRGGQTTAPLQLLVADTTAFGDAGIIAWYPFSGNAMDISGHELHGQVSGARLVPDSLGRPLEAYHFDGVNDHITVTNDPILNVEDGITVSLFVRPEDIGDKERFIISHGSWHNRWKISITPERKVRWTIKNNTGQVKDLDALTPLESGRQYHLACAYSGNFMMVYLNGRLESFSSFSGALAPSPVDLEIGQMVPGDNMYNFSGILDEIKIFDAALSPMRIASESGMTTGIHDTPLANIHGIEVFPNPAQQSITIRLFGDLKGQHQLAIFNMNGQIVWSGTTDQGVQHHIDVTHLQPGLYSIGCLCPVRHIFQKLILL
jgi:hypothetical protein